MSYRVIIKKKAIKGIKKSPINIQKKMKFLVDDLKDLGPEAHN
jgi:mRNA-degrading endonuclease RelE of RelBE toxin-antitoxin system